MPYTFCRIRVQKKNVVVNIVVFQSRSILCILRKHVTLLTSVHFLILRQRQNYPFLHGLYNSFFVFVLSSFFVFLRTSYDGKTHFPSSSVLYIDMIEYVCLFLATDIFVCLIILSIAQPTSTIRLTHPSIESNTTILSYVI